uniref:Uncharacterized protein n=1 Tax=Romanomermis culicivorax TaxID=13658 RepID=A0A915KEW5_ROMCU
MCFCDILGEEFRAMVNSMDGHVTQNIIFFSGLSNEKFTEWAKKLGKQMIYKGYKWCRFDNCPTVENLIVEEEQVVSWDGESFISTISDLSSRKANAGHCVMADGVIASKLSRTKNALCTEQGVVVWFDPSNLTQGEPIKSYP